MRFLMTIIAIAIVAAVGEFILPWWACAAAAFLVALQAGLTPGRSFVAGFCGIALFWLVAALMHDVTNHHILSRKMAVLFHLPGYGLFILVTVIVGGLIGGLSAWSGALLKSR
jgi:hypothetical protein